MIPFDVMVHYAAMDAIVTFLLFQKFEKAIVRMRNLHGI